jgi:transaldolase
MVPTLLLTPAGLAAGRYLKQCGARVAFTCVSTVEQAECAAEAGADWGIRFAGRLRRAGVDPIERIARAARVIRLDTASPGILRPASRPHWMCGRSHPGSRG